MNTTEYQNHPLLSRLSTIESLLKSDQISNVALGPDVIMAGNAERVAALNTVLQQLVVDTPASLVSLAGLNTIDQHVQAVVGELAAFNGDNNLGHLANAASYIENTQSLFWTFAPTSPAAGRSPLPQLLAEQAEVARHSIAGLVATRAAAAAEFEGLRKTSEVLEARLAELSEGAARERAEAAATVARLEAMFVKAETERNTANEAALLALDAGFKEFERGAKSDAVTLLLELEGKKDQASQIVQVVGNIGVTGNYQQIANTEGEQANVWRWITVGIFAVGIGIAVATFCRFWGEQITGANVAAIAIRLFYAIAITAPAWYTAKESARHRTNSDRARQSELELASIGPFIELMPDERKYAIREDLTKRFFGRTVEEHTADHPFDPKDIKELVVELAKVLRK